MNQDMSDQDLLTRARALNDLIGEPLINELIEEVRRLRPPAGLWGWLEDSSNPQNDGIEWWASPDGRVGVEFRFGDGLTGHGLTLPEAVRALLREIEAHE